ncbi:MAG TPA: START domain-containing protein [Spirochaetota bacterium]|nr:START domain-containing protein [Spirochaetota bacterium]HPC39641.1 START domain-containing protein [Spirochaetota bacterium]HPL15996.1 START domain-containing protein [Spirochaetota bacterium]HQF07367.1 START domain-containing protein [Spirochaetota bacterium]HQH99225.1 START domain-containing protein [Spirochaetota bacterium]
MKKICYQSAAVIVTLSLFITSVAPAQENNWTLKKNRKGIQVYTRDVPGSDFKEFRATIVVEATMAGVLKLMEDIRSYPLWFPKLKESLLLKKISSTEMILYHWMKVPFPADDRDSVFKVTARRDARTKTVTLGLSSLPDYLPERKGIIRVRQISGSWTFIPDKDRGTVTVIYQMHSDPGGKLTPLLANAAVVNRPFTVLKNMREMLKKPEYRDAKDSELQLFR